jgi:hypothetical protein
MILGQESHDVWYPIDILEADPIPEVCLAPIGWAERIKITQDATDRKSVAAGNDYKIHESMDFYRLSLLGWQRAIRGFRHLEYPDGTPVNADDKGLRYVLDHAPQPVIKWINDKISKISSDADDRLLKAKEHARKNS